MLTALSGASLILYAAGAMILWSYARSRRNHTPRIRHTIIALVAGGLLLHGVGLYSTLFGTSGLNLTLGQSFSVVAWTAVFLYLIAAIVKPAANLGLAVLPLAIISIATGLALNSPVPIAVDRPPSFGIHLLLGTVSFGILTLALAQAALIIFQDQQLRQPKTHETRGFFFPSLPALQTMESILFQLLVLGFILLSANLAIGVIFNRQVIGSSVSFNHHIILSGVAWLGFGVVLAGHHWLGWRGNQAAKYTILVFAIFLLGFFGPRIVNELILSRA